MDKPQLPSFLNPNNFPAKLWQLVNSPRFRSICWNARGEGVLINQTLFEYELLGAGPGRAAGLAGDQGATELFKTKNFASFIRQLNLYGFRKVLMGPAGSAAGTEPQLGLWAGNGDGNGSGSAGPLHHFQSPHFRRDRPDLLVHLKRLTSANKAKLAAGLEVNSRPPNRFQRLQGTSLHGDTLQTPSTLGLTAVGQFHQPCQQSFSPYSNTPTSSQNQGALLTKSLDRTPVPPRPQQGSFVVLPGYGAIPAFPGKGPAFPSLRRCSTEVTYTVRTVCSILPLEQWARTIGTSRPNYSTCTSSVQYSQASYPTAPLQCSSAPAHVDPLPDCASLPTSTYTESDFFQGSPLQPFDIDELLPSDWLSDTSDENKIPELDLEAVFQLVEEMESSPKAEAVQVEPLESQYSTPQCNGDQLQLVNSEDSNTLSSSTEENQLEFLSSVAPGAPFMMGAEQAALEPSEFLCATHTNAFVESAVAEIVQESVITKEASNELREQPYYYPDQLSAVLAEAGLFGPEQVNTGVNYEYSTSKTEESQFASGTEPVNKPVEEIDASVTARCRKRKHSSHEDNNSALCLPVPCKRQCFGRGETRE